ncbi:hypothetical protein Nepgr_016090 [Nepenthes gracilis]|uniref:Uncharacterized protein n=1 Tax=Nepenthes gracilis TaxID=150966 RepID=A0AAD3XRQ6_NEPGR|nr:hypothetical protein Nepgr_016090 [Nepenthes gracilis]
MVKVKIFSSPSQKEMAEQLRGSILKFWSNFVSSIHFSPRTRIPVKPDIRIYSGCILKTLMLLGVDMKNGCVVAFSRTIYRMFVTLQQVGMLINIADNDWKEE